MIDFCGKWWQCVKRAAGAGTTSLAAPIIAKVADNSGSLKPVVDTVGGLAIGYATGGTTGAFTGANADWNNRQLHPDETRLLNKLRKGKSAEEQYRLTAAACALTHCADGVPKSDKYYKVLKDLQTAGEQFTAEKALLQQQGVGLKNGKFQYSFANGGSDDFITRKGKAISKTSSAADTVLGSLGVVGGYTLASVGCAGTMGIGCTPSIIAGAGISTLSLQQAQSGSERLFSTYQSPYGNLVLQSLVEPTEYYSATNNAAGNVALWTAETFALKGLGRVLGGGKALNGVGGAVTNTSKTTVKKADDLLDTVTPPSTTNSAGKANTPPSVKGHNISSDFDDIIRQAENISTAKSWQATTPRDLNEQTLWNLVKREPQSGTPLPLSSDSRFPNSAGFQKMQANHKLPDGSNITIHYQYNANTGKAYDMKIVTPQRISPALQPGASIKD